MKDRELILRKADFMDQWRAMLAAGPLVNPPRLTQPGKPKDQRLTAAEESRLREEIERSIKGER